MRTFVMGDLHGAYKALQQCLERAGFDSKKDRLIQLGDVADGYPEVYECVECLLKIPNLVAIKGNHDDWLNEFIQTAYHPLTWSFGGDGTARSYLRHVGKKGGLLPAGNGYKTALNPTDIPEHHRQFFQQQLLYYIDEGNNCYVHGGFDRNIKFERQRPEIYYWDRSLWLAALTFDTFEKKEKGKHRFRMATPFNEIFIGHTCTTKWNMDRPMNAVNIHNLDTGARHIGRLTMMEVESKQFWQSDPVEQLYAAKKSYAN